jgi:very-short-patch-repair endonuclease
VKRTPSTPDAIFRNNHGIAAAAAVTLASIHDHAPRLPPTLDTDARIHELAARFHGVVSRAELLGVGIPMHAFEYRLKRGRLHLLFDGVYRVGPVAAPHEREAAALLACGPRRNGEPGGVLSHTSAARLWGLTLAQTAHADAIDVTVGRYRRPSAGLRLHRVTHLHPDDVTLLDGLTVTTPARTIADMASIVNGRTLEQMLAFAEREGLSSMKTVLATIDRLPRRKGIRRLRELCTAADAPSLTRSDAEARFLALARKGQLPPPKTNVQVLGYEVDALWRAEKLIVEVDGFAFHSSRDAFERDRVRDSQLGAHGYRVMRVTWKQLQEEPEAVLVRVALALGRTSA